MRNFFDRFIKFIKDRKFFVKFFKKNLALKLLALFISISFWAILVSQDPTLTRSKYFEQVPVAVMGEDTLKRNGFITLNNFKKENSTVNFTADVPQMHFETAKASNYSPKIDLSSINKVGEVDVPITTFSNSAYGTVKSIQPNVVKVNVDNYITQYRVPIQYEILGEYPKNLYATDPILDPKTVQVSGPASIVEKVAKAVVHIDANIYKNATEGQKRTTLPFKLYDAQDKLVNSEFLQVTSDTIKINNVVVTQNIYNLKSFKLSSLGLLEGEIKPGYYIKGITITPSIVYVAGASELLDNLDNIYTNETININNRSTSLIKNINLNIPTEAVYSSTKNAVVALEIEPVIKTKIFTDIPIILVGKNENYAYDLGNKKLDVTIKGPINELDGIKHSQIQLELDVSQLSEGSYDLPVNYFISNNQHSKLDVQLGLEKVKLFVEKK